MPNCLTDEENIKNNYFLKVNNMVERSGNKGQMFFSKAFTIHVINKTTR